MQNRCEYLLRSEGLLKMAVFEETRNGKNITSGVHQDKEEDARQIESRQRRVILHHVVQEQRYFLHQYWIEC